MKSEKMKKYFSEAALDLLRETEWDIMEKISNPSRIRLSNWEGNVELIPYLDEKIEVQDIPDSAYFCSCVFLSSGFHDLVTFDGRATHIGCLYGYDYSWCGAGLVFRGTADILHDVMKRLEQAGLDVVSYPVDKAWRIMERSYLESRLHEYETNTKTAAKGCCLTKVGEFHRKAMAIRAILEQAQ